MKKIILTTTLTLIALFSAGAVLIQPALAQADNCTIIGNYGGGSYGNTYGEICLPETDIEIGGLYISDEMMLMSVVLVAAGIVLFVNGRVTLAVANKKD